MATMIPEIPACEDAWLLAPDGVIDTGAIMVAANGLRLVRLTRQERQISTAVILVNGGTPTTVRASLGLPSEATTLSLVNLMTHDVTVWRVMLKTLDLNEIVARITAEILGLLDTRYVLHILRVTRQNFGDIMVFLIILLLAAGLAALMIRNFKIRARANRIRAQRASEGQSLSRKTSYLAAKAQLRDERQARRGHHL